MGRKKRKGRRGEEEWVGRERKRGRMVGRGEEGDEREEEEGKRRKMYIGEDEGQEEGMVGMSESGIQGKRKE